MKIFFENAVENIIRYGDTDIFPFPIENFLFFDQKLKIVDLLLDIHTNFRQRLSGFPPAHEGALAPISYTGFRWATQLDPLWNAYFLGLTLSIAEAIEQARIPASENIVFSYRYAWNSQSTEIFDKEFHWRRFMECSLKNAAKCAYVVTCDISEFYLRLSHHRLENALKQARVDVDIPWRIMEFLANFANTNSFGIPVGGPAARILSELTINQIDRLLKAEGIKFCRFSDDFHLFCESIEEAYQNLLFLSEKLLSNQGLQLQKSKTRVMSRSEFVDTSPFHLDDEADASELPKTDEQKKARDLLRFSLRFDPYSLTREEDYRLLQNEIARFDILGLLRSELSKTRIHISLARKIIAALRFVEPSPREDALLSLFQNTDLLYPVFASVMIAAKSAFGEMGDEAQLSIVREVMRLIRSRSHILGVELHVIYAVRLLSCRQVDDSADLLAAMYKQSTSSLLRRDIILVMAKWEGWYWLSDLRNQFRTLSPLERRSFIIASYKLSDEGKHWRGHIQPELTPFEKVVQEWMADRIKIPNWEIPL
jgi:hypothetical protein